ncbi:MAG TPA: hypothetical protein DCE56_25125 [Cyanobacteria bacterium UBA8553]|nr:hypothetical protein [Cyanobacteria bacterium UBA8553]
MRSLFKNPSVRLVGAMCILLGTTWAPSQATTLTGFSTYGNMMSGMRVTANFLNGSSESVLWNSTGNGAGGVFGTGWSLTQSGNSYDSPWTFNSSSQVITSLVIAAIPGNTVFDTYPYLFGPIQTNGSAEGLEFQSLVGQGPNIYNYSDPIDISAGDLFGTLSLYWNAGFTGTLQFLADTDSGSRNDPVAPRQPEVTNAPPTVYFSAPTIDEGQSASTTVAATDPSNDAIAFLLNNGYLGTDLSGTGIRSVATNLGFFADNGQYTYTAQARDEDGNYSNPVISTLTVLNVAPIVASLNIPAIDEGQSASASMSATDPGADSISFWLNGNNIGTDASTSGTRATTTNLGYFADNGYIPYTGYALDKDNSWSAPAYSGLTVLNVAPSLTRFRPSDRVIDEGQSVSARLFATDPGADGQTFFVNGINVGTNLRTSGTRWQKTNLGTFYDEGLFTFTGQAEDKDKDVSNTLTRKVRVLNVAPTVTDLTNNLIVNTNDLFDFSAAATDPGIYDLLTYDWDFNGDGIFDDFTGTSGQWSYADAGTYDVMLRVSDGDGGVAYRSFKVETVTAQGVPEPSSVLGVLVFSAFGAGAAWKRKQQRKTKG